MKYTIEEIEETTDKQTLRIMFKNGDGCVDIYFNRKDSTVYVDLRETDNIEDSCGAAFGIFEDVF